MSESTTELAVHFAATVHNADAAALCDSAEFMARVSQLGPDTPGFVDRVSAAVRDAVQPGARFAPAGESPRAPETPAAQPERVMSRNERLAYKATRRAQLTPDYAGEITVREVEEADVQVVAEWATRGRLAHLGIPAQKRHR